MGEIIRTIGRIRQRGHGGEEMGLGTGRSLKGPRVKRTADKMQGGGFLIFKQETPDQIQEPPSLSL